MCNKSLNVGSWLRKNVCKICFGKYVIHLRKHTGRKHLELYIDERKNINNAKEEKPL